MDIDSIAAETAEQLGVSRSDLKYITDDYILEMSKAEEEDENIDEETLDSGEKIRGVYCNSLTYDSGTGGYLRYKRGKKGTSNYGCGTDPYKKSKAGTTVKQVGSCSGGRAQYLVTW